MLINHFTQHFGGRVFGQREKTFVVFDQHGDDWIILVQQKIMIKVLIDIAFNKIFDVGKVADHALIVKLLLLYRNRGFHTMAVQISAFARMVHQPMAVAEIDLFGNRKHKNKTAS